MVSKLLGVAGLGYQAWKIDSRTKKHKISITIPLRRRGYILKTRSRNVQNRRMHGLLTQLLGVPVSLLYEIVAIRSSGDAQMELRTGCDWPILIKHCTHLHPLAVMFKTAWLSKVSRKLYGKRKGRQLAWCLDRHVEILRIFEVRRRKAVDSLPFPRKSEGGGDLPTSLNHQCQCCRFGPWEERKDVPRH